MRSSWGLLSSQQGLGSTLTFFSPTLLIFEVQEYSHWLYPDMVGYSGLHVRWSKVHTKGHALKPDDRAHR